MWSDKLPFFNSDRFDKVMNQITTEISNGVTIFPDIDDILNAYYYTAFEDIKVVILGQDPYHTKGYAHGLAFSVPEDIIKLPKSLQNIYTEMNSDIGCCPSNGCLIPWAKQGVFLLNTSLTVIEGSPGSHNYIGWGELVNETIQAINNDLYNVVFVLWGSHAQSKSRLINGRKHYILETAHPSPLSAYRGFFGSKPFSKVNDYLLKNDKSIIKWC